MMNNHKQDTDNSFPNGRLHNEDNKLALDELLSKLDDEEKQEAADREKKKKEQAAKRKKVVIAILAIAGVFVVGAVLIKTLVPVLFPFKYDTTASGDCPGNTVNGAKACVQDDKIYYVKYYNSSLENEDGDEIDSSRQAAVYSSNVRGGTEDLVFSIEDEVEEASISLRGNELYILEKLKIDYDIEGPQEARVIVVDISTGEVIRTLQSDVSNVDTLFILGDQIVFDWWVSRSEEEYNECLSIASLDGSNFKTIYETSNGFDYTWDAEKIYVAETVWDGEETGRRVITSMSLTGENSTVIWEEKLSEDDYWNGLYIYDGQLIQTKEILSYDDEDEFGYKQLVSLTPDSGETNIIAEWEESLYANAFGNNLYANYYYYNHYNEKKQDYQINRINLTNGESEQVMDLPNVPYMEGPSVDILLFEDNIVLNMKEMDYEEEMDDTAWTTDRNRIFLYDLNGKQHAEFVV